MTATTAIGSRRCARRTGQNGSSRSSTCSARRRRGWASRRSRMHSACTARRRRASWGPWPPAASSSATPATRRYRLGPRLVGLAATAVARLPVVSQARPELEQLSAATSETANLAILDRLHVVYVDQVTPAQTVVMASWVGRRSPVHASSSGKVLVAFGDPKLREALLAPAARTAHRAHGRRSRCARPPPARRRPSGVRIEQRRTRSGAGHGGGTGHGRRARDRGGQRCGPVLPVPGSGHPSPGPHRDGNRPGDRPPHGGPNQLVKADPIRGSRPTCGRSGRHRLHRP